MNTSDATPRQIRSMEKRDVIAAAALKVFLDQGYVGASVDEIAAEAEVSKRTVYAHFGDKEQLFRAVITSTIAPMQLRLKKRLAALVDDDPEEALLALAQSLAQMVVVPQVVRLRRLVSAEADRFPDLAAMWYRLGPEQTVAQLDDYLRRLSSRGALLIPDTRTAAEQLLWLSISTPINRLMFMPSGATAEPMELERSATHAFTVFWRAYGAGPTE